LIPLLVFLLSLAAPGRVLCKTAEGGPDVYTLGGVVVSEKRQGVESVGTVRVVTAEDIRNKGARTLDEALDLLPGVNIRVGAGGIPRVDIRGFRSRHVLLLLDGIPLNSTFDGQFDPSIIPVENIAQIKVSYGNSSVLYGPGALGGVINIITRKGKKGVQGMLGGEAGEGEHRLGRLRVSGGGDRATFFYSASWLERDGFRLSDDFEPTPDEDGGLRENSDRSRKNLFTNLVVSPTQAWNMGISFGYLKSAFGFPPSTKQSTKKAPDPFASNPKYERQENSRGFSGQFSSDVDLPGPAELRGWFYINQLDEERARYDDENYNSMLGKNSFFEDSRSRVWGGTLQARCEHESLGTLTLGLDAQRQGYRSRGAIRDQKVGKDYFFRNFDDEQNLDLYSAALEYEVYLLKKLGLVLGYSHHWLHKESGDDDQGSCLAGMYVDIFEDTRIHGSAARKIRFPSIKQLYQAGSGNPGLTTEKSYNYEFGIEQVLPCESRAALTGFLLYVKDYIEKIDPDPLFKNYDKYRFQGFELTSETRFVENLLLRLGYTFLYSRDDSPGTEKQELQNRPKHKVTFEGDYAFDFGFSAYLSVLFVADQVFYSRKSPLQKRSHQDHVLVNTKLQQELLDGVLKLYVGADNLLDEDIDQSYGFPQAGRTVYGGAELSF